MYRNFLTVFKDGASVDCKSLYVVRCADEAYGELDRYRKKSSEILVKVLMNEKEVRLLPLNQDLAPYYKWSDFERYYTDKIAKIK